MKDLLKQLIPEHNFKKRLFLVIFAVIMMGFALSWLVLVDMGTDPCTSMNLTISRKIGWTIGNWQAFLNCLLFIIVIFFGRNNIGFGTLANMFLVGYSLDFFSWLWSKLLPEGLFDSMLVRSIVLVPALIFFVFVAAIYMNVQLGTAPYDALVYIIAKPLHKIPFRLIRMAYDFTVIFITISLGGKVGIVTILMAFTLGPIIGFVGKKMEPLIGNVE